MTDVAPPPGWTMPEGYTFSRLGACRSCQASIAWTTTPAGRPSPLDRDGHSHFGTCPDADRWRRRRAAS